MKLFDTTKSVLISGSTLGIGKAIAEAFLQEGCLVFVNGRSQNSVDQVVNEFKTKYPQSQAPVAVVGDVSTAEGVAKVIETVDSYLGEERSLDILVNNVSIFGGLVFFFLIFWIGIFFPHTSNQHPYHFITKNNQQSKTFLKSRIRIGKTIST